MSNTTTSIPETFADKITPLLDSISDSKKRSIVKEFWHNAVVPYFSELESISEGLNTGTLDYEEATDRTMRATSAVLASGNETENQLADDELVKQLKAYFRVTGAPYGLASKAVRHALEKPGGYPGDYELLEFIYGEVPTSDKFGYCADMVFLEDDYARAVRSRKNVMKTVLIDYLNDESQNPRNILNIACGASRELREIFAENTFNLKFPVTFNMIDKSKEALSFSKEQLANSPDNIKYNFLNNSVYDYLKDPETHSRNLQGQDLIYSIGLADYIPAESLKEQIKFFYDLLNPGGRLIIAHKDSKNFIPLTPDWWADWTFYLRDEDEVVNLVKTSGITNYTLTVEREKATNIIFFLNIEKR